MIWFRVPLCSLGLAMAAATPALARKRRTSPGLRCDGQTVGENFVEAGVSNARAAALRKCNDEVGSPLKN